MPKQQRRQENHKICEFPTNEVCASLLRLGNNPDNRREVKAARRILYLSAKSQVLRKSRHSGLSHHFTSSMSFYHKNK